jgi:hypothetical protein
MPNTYTAPQIAARLGMSARQINHLARQHGIGRKIGRDWHFTEAEMKWIRDKRPKCGPPKR